MVMNRCTIYQITIVLSTGLKCIWNDYRGRFSSILCNNLVLVALPCFQRHRCALPLDSKSARTLAVR